MKPLFFIIGLLAMVLLIPAAVSATGNITVSSTPDGASIYLDGAYQGLTTKTIEAVTSGDHTIVLTRSGYVNYTFSSFPVSDDQTTPLTAVLTAVPPAPTISSLSPNNGYNSSSVTATISGTGFSTSLTTSSIVLMKSGQINITAASFTALSTTSITCSFPITGKPAGVWTVVVTNPDGQYDDYPFTINDAGSTITLTSITPNNGLVNTTISVTSLVGTNFMSTSSMKLSRSGYNDIPGTVSSYSSTQLAGTFDLSGRAPGTYQVCVANDAATYVCGLSFAVTSPDTVNGTFSITSSPSNSNVYIDSVLRGLTPLILYNITPDTYIVSIRKNGYISYSHQFAVTAGNTTYVGATLSADVTDTPTYSYPTATRTTTPLKPSTLKTYTPWPTATPTPQSPVPIELCCAAIALGLIAVQKKN